MGGDLPQITDGVPFTPELFVEFEASASHYAENLPLNRIGVHVVPLKRARRSRLFSILPPLPESVERAKAAYALVVYVERLDNPLELSSVGMVVGLDREGRLVGQQPFPINGQYPAAPDGDPAWQAQLHLVTFLVYLVFALFEKLNRGKLAVHQREAPGQWVVVPGEEMLVSEYEITGFPGSGLMLTEHPQYGQQVWSLVRLGRKHRDDRCALCGLPVGGRAYRPLANRGNRAERICTRHAPGAEGSASS
jgi:hypothetical protein